MRANLVAVQARLDLERYASFSRFRAAMSDLVTRACKASDASLPTLIVLPEGIGLFLSFAPYYYDELRGRRTVAEAVWRVALRHWPGYAPTALRYRVIGLRTALLRHAPEAREAYVSTFSELARREGVYIVAGTSFLPEVDERPLHAPRIRGRDVYNVAPFFGPGGNLLMWTTKQHRASRWERRFAFAEGKPTDVYPAETSLGKVGVLVCHDSMRGELLQRCDALGTRVLAVPAYNLAPWQALVRGTEITHEQAWLDRGLPSLIQGRENIRYAVCAMLVGGVFDLRSEGRSFICENVGSGPGKPVLALAASAREEEVVVVQADLGNAGERAGQSWSADAPPRPVFSARR